MSTAPPAADDSFELYDLRVQVVLPPERAGQRILCNAREGDWFEVRGELLHFPPGQAFSMYSLAALLPLDRLFGAEAEDGSLDQLLLSGLPRSALAAAKALGHWLTTGVPLIAATPIAAAMLNLPVEAWGVAMAALALATALLSLLGTLGAALTLGARRGGVLLPLLVLPLAIPAVIFGAAAIEAASAGLSAAPFLLLLGAGVSIAAPLAPLAAGAALSSD
jgi:heme exporter protein B